MQNDTTLPAAQRRNYRNVLDAWRQMYHEPHSSKSSGISSLFRGVWANSTRAAIMTSSQLAAYDAFKDALVAKAGMRDNLLTHFTASILAGLVATTLCSPIDVLKTQIMSTGGSSSSGKAATASTATTATGGGGGGSKPIATIIAELFKSDGPKWMLRGWVPSFTRLGPQTVATFVILEQHRKLYRLLMGLD